MSNKVTTIITSDKAVANNESRLSICLRSNGFSFSIISLSSELVTFGEAEFDFNLSLGELSQAIKDFFVSCEISTFGFKQANLIVHSNHFVWIPSHLYDSSRDRQYLRMVSSPDLSLGTFHTFVSSLDSFIVFSADASVVTAFKLAIPGIDVHCQHSSIASSDIMKKSVGHPLMLMHLCDGVGDFDVFYGGELLLSNSFSVNNNQELLFRALGIMKQMHIETPDMELAICGNVNRELFGFLQHYFPNVTLYSGRVVTSNNPDFKTLPTYRHAIMLS
ncbi:MAG: DUF3822 family protein [Bacteroidales bacterium]|nr:DUF3822 family protein [Bacteroidales bacterium]